MKTISNLIECTFCFWVGEEDELLTQMVDNQSNPQDHTLYEEVVCPQCKKDFETTKTDYWKPSYRHRVY